MIPVGYLRHPGVDPNENDEDAWLDSEFAGWSHGNGLERKDCPLDPDRQPNQWRAYWIGYGKGVHDRELNPVAHGMSARDRIKQAISDNIQLQASGFPGGGWSFVGLDQTADLIIAALEPGEAFYAALARQVHRQANGPSAWERLTNNGRMYYVDRIKRAYIDAANSLRPSEE